MDFQIYTQTNFELQTKRFLQDLLERGFSKSTIAGYKSYLNRLKKYIFSIPGQIYTEKTARTFIENVVPTLSVSASTKKHIRASI